MSDHDWKEDLPREQAHFLGLDRPPLTTSESQELVKRLLALILSLLCAWAVWDTFTTPTAQWNWLDWLLLCSVTANFFIDSYRIFRD